MGLERLSNGVTVGAKWSLRRRIGRGGMGEVWLALHTSLQQEVAVKFLDDGAFGTDLLDEARSRFHLEAQLAADLSRRTRHIAQVIDHGSDGGLDYLVMELLVGDTLEDLLQRDRRMDPTTLAEVIRQAARGLQVAHAEGVTHRDLKPSNVFVTRDDEGSMLVKLLDFGIAKADARARARACHGDRDPDTQSQPASNRSHRTRAGVILGTAAYMSPEQARGLETDARIDLWALACVAYEMLTGSLPFVAESDIDLLMKICMTQPPAPSTLAPGLRADVDEVFARAFASSIDDRFPDARAFADALGAALCGVLPAPFALGTQASGASSVDATDVAMLPPRYHRNKRPLVLAGAVVLSGVVAMGLFLKSPERAAPAAPPVASSAPVASPSVASPSVASIFIKPPQVIPAGASVSSPRSASQTPKSLPAKPKPSTTASAKHTDKGEIF